MINTQELYGTLESRQYVKAIFPAIKNDDYSLSFGYQINPGMSLRWMKLTAEVKEENLKNIQISTDVPEGKKLRARVGNLDDLFEVIEALDSKASTLYVEHNIQRAIAIHG